METQLEWKIPKVVLDWEKQQSKSFALNALLAINKAVWLVMAVLLALAYYWKPLVFSEAEFHSWFKMTALVGFLGPSAFTLLMFGPVLFKPFSHKDRCTVDSRGIFCGNWFDNWNVRWKWINQYHFVDHAEIAGIRVVEIKINRFKIEKQDVARAVSFDPQITPEIEIEAFFGRYFEGSAKRVH